MSNEDLLPPASTSCPEEILITEEYVALLKLDVLKPTGIDGISSKMLKHTVLNIAPSLAKFFNLSIRSGCYPNSCKVARINIVPIPNADEMTSPAKLIIDKFRYFLLLVRSWSITLLASSWIT